jgi:hypothetical protein
MSNVIRGTAKELMEKKLTIGGILVDQATLYALGRIGIARNVGEQKMNPKSRGRASTVWELDHEINLNLTAVLA